MFFKHCDRVDCLLCIADQRFIICGIRGGQHTSVLFSPLSRMAFYGNTKSANQSEKSFCASARSVPMIVVAFSLILESSEPNGSPGKLVVQTKEMVCGQCKRRRKVNRITQRVCIVVDIVEMIISHTKFCSRVLAKAAAASGIAVGIDFHPNVHHPTALI